MKRVRAVFPLILSCILLGCFQYTALDSSVPRISKEELRSLLGKPEVTVVDVRTEDDWKRSAWKIKGAVREDPEEGIDPGKYSKGKTLVFY